MATLTVQQIAEAGLSANYSAAAAGGDTFQNASNDRIFLHVKNGDTVSHTVTIAATPSSYNIPGLGRLTKNDISVAVGASGDRFIGPISLSAFGANPDIQYDAVTGVTLAVIKLPSTSGN